MMQLRRSGEAALIDLCEGAMRYQVVFVLFELEGQGTRRTVKQITDSLELPPWSLPRITQIDLDITSGTRFFRSS